MDALKAFDNVSGVSAVLRANVIVRSFFKSETAQVFGIVLEDHLKVSDMERQVAIGTIEDFREAPAGAMIGRVLADRLQITVGDSFTIDLNGQSRRYRIAAIYETGVRDIDKTRIFLHMKEARSLLKKTRWRHVHPGKPVRQGPCAAGRPAYASKCFEHSAQSLAGAREGWLSAFSALRISSAITVSVFTLIAGLAMFNTLAMIVLEKTKDIAILRSMGYERRGHHANLSLAGGIVLAIGAVLRLPSRRDFDLCVSPISRSDSHGIFKTKHFLVDPGQVALRRGRG